MWILLVLVFFPIFYWFTVGRKSTLSKFDFWLDTFYLTPNIFLFCVLCYHYGVYETEKQEDKIFFIRNNKIEQVKDTLFVLEKDTISNKDFRKQKLFTSEELGR